MTAKHIPIVEAARLYGVDRRTIQRKVAKGELERVTLKNGQGGVTVRSLEAAYGATNAAAADCDTPQRQGATPATLPHAARRAASATYTAPDPADELRQRLAAAEAAADELRKTLEHERADREKERSAWGAKYELLAQSLIAVKGADAVRDVAEIKRLEGKGDIIDGEVTAPSRDEKPASPPRAGGGSAKKKPTKATPTPADPPPARGGLAGVWARLWSK